MSSTVSRSIVSFLSIAFTCTACFKSSSGGADDDEDDSETAPEEDTGPDTEPENCADAIDNDGDQYVDCEDPDCRDSVRCGGI